jgi:hypothetical protein
MPLDSRTLHDMVMTDEIPWATFRIAELLRDGHEVDAEDFCFGTPLQIASLRGSVEIVALLLEQGADLLKETFAWRNAIQSAASHGHEDVLTLLLHAADQELDSKKRGRYSRVRGQV